MNSRKRSQLKRNPLIRFVRGIIRFFNNLFNPKKSTSRFTPSHQAASGENDRFDPLTSNGFITVGELFEQVKWQSPPAQELDLGVISDTSKNARTQDVSRN